MLHTSYSLFRLEEEFLLQNVMKLKLRKIQCDLISNINFKSSYIKYLIHYNNMFYYIVLLRFLMYTRAIINQFILKNVFFLYFFSEEIQMHLIHIKKIALRSKKKYELTRRHKLSYGQLYRCIPLRI